MATRVQLDFPAMRGSDVREHPRVSRGGSLIAWAIATAARWWQRRMLEELDERMLHDIGISRSQALAEARKPCWRP
jgi:uncharacterized protein YjiS (DUF1127 family)